MMKILLIEDNPDVRENTAEILMLALYQVITATNGKEGVDLAKKELPDLVICDIMMPVLDGHGVLHVLSKDPATASIPFIFLTAKAERSDIRKGMDMGADDYLTKPFDEAELLSAIESRLKRNQNLKKEFERNVRGLKDFIMEASGMERLRTLSREGEVRLYKKKDGIYRAGAHPKGIYFVNRGKVKSYHTNEAGKELITELYKEGEFFGYLALLGGQEYSDSAMALEESEIYMMDKRDFFSLLYEYPDVSAKFVELLSNNVQQQEMQLVKLAYNSVRKRVAEALLKLSDKYGKEDNQAFSMNISRDDLANLVGTATETVIRTLSDFREERLIEISGSKITILEPRKLASLKN